MRGEFAKVSLASRVCSCRRTASADGALPRPGSGTVPIDFNVLVQGFGVIHPVSTPTYCHEEPRTPHAPDMQWMLLMMSTLLAGALPAAAGSTDNQQAQVVVCRAEGHSRAL